MAIVENQMFCDKCKKLIFDSIPADVLAKFIDDGPMTDVCASCEVSPGTGNIRLVN